MTGSAGPELDRLEQVMTRLRAGCPWDRVQDLRSLRPYLLEETYEVLEEMDRAGYGGSWTALSEELGDLLFQIVFHAELARERSFFDLGDVCRAVADKLVSRHPHVFGETAGKVKADTPDQVLANWAQLKAAERKRKTGTEGSALDGVPLAAPALMRAERLTEKAARVGFDWPDITGARAKLTEELEELDEAIRGGDRDALEHELGDVLLATVNVGRFLKTPPEDALRQALQRFTRRFQTIESGLRAEGVPFGEAGLERMEAHWQRAKAEEAQLPPPQAQRFGPSTWLRIALPHWDAARPVIDLVFSQLDWRREAANGELRCWDAPLGFVFVPSEPSLAGDPSVEVSLEAPSLESVRSLHARLVAHGLTIDAPTLDSRGASVLAFRDPSGLRWRYATR